MKIEDYMFDNPPFKKVFSEDIKTKAINLSELSKHKTRGCNTPTGARHCVFEGVEEVEK